MRFLPRLFLFCLAILLFYTAIPASADFEEDYQGFLKTYDKYRTDQAAYIKTRNQYLTYGTLTSKNEAITGVRDFLISRNYVLLSYSSLLRSRNSDSLLAGILDEEEKLIKAHSEKASSLASLEDAVRLSKTIEDQHIAFQIISRKIVGTILINKVRDLQNQFILLERESNALIQTLKNTGKETSSLERWLLDATNKEMLADQKLLLAITQLNALQAYNLEELSKNYNKIQFTIFEANQYLKEGLAYLRELGQTIKYGKY